MRKMQDLLAITHVFMTWLKKTGAVDTSAESHETQAMYCMCLLTLIRREAGDLEAGSYKLEFEELYPKFKEFMIDKTQSEIYDYIKE